MNMTSLGCPSFGTFIKEERASENAQYNSPKTRETSVICLSIASVAGPPAELIPYDIPSF